jgi:hypothetical protein
LQATHRKLGSFPKRAVYAFVQISQRSQIALQVANDIGASRTDLKIGGCV